jgi:hypothetical protein
MAIFPQNAVIPAQNPYPASLIVPAAMTEAQFRFGLDKAGVYFYETEVYRTVKGYVTHVGFLWTGLAIYRAGGTVEEGGDPGSVTPAVIARSFAWAETSPVVVLVDTNPCPVSDIFTKFFGDMLGGIVGNLPVIGWIIDAFSGEKYEPVRWLPIIESVGPNTVHIAWVYWDTASPSQGEIEQRLGELGVTVLGSWPESYRKIPFYTGGKGGVVQLALAIPDRAVPILSIAKAIKATDIRVSTEAVYTSGVSVDVALEKLIDTLFTISNSTLAIVGATASTAGAAAGVADKFLGDPGKLGFYLKVGLGVLVGAVGIWGVSQLVSAMHGGRVSSPTDFWPARGAASKARRGVRRTKSVQRGRSSSQPLALPAHGG